MKRSSQFADLFKPWAGLVVATLAAGIAHQFGSEGVFDDCSLISPVPLLIVCALGLVACVVAGSVSWGVARSGSEGPGRQLAGVLSAGTAAVFVIAIVLPMIAAVMLPPCFQ
jgi:hypothetical protein